MNNKLKISLSEPLIRFKETGSIFNAPYFPRCEIDNHRLWVSDDSVRPLGRFCDQKPYKYQDNPFSVEYLFTYNFAGQINMTNFKMHPSWEKANVVIRIWGAWIDHNTRIMKGKWHLLYEVSHSKDPSESYKECSELITSIRIELNGNFLMYPEFIESLTNHCEVEEPTYFPLFFPLHKVLYEGVQILTHNVVPKIEANSNGENFTEYLPNEILYNIFNHLDLRSLSRCAQVNKRWNSITSDPRFYQEMDLKMYWYKFSIDTVEKLKEKFQIVRKLDLTWFTNMAYPVLYNKQEKLQYNAILINILESAKDTLTHLCLNHTNIISDETMEQIFECPNLEELRLRCDWLKRFYPQMLKFGLELTSLKTLDLSFTIIMKTSLIEVLKKAPNLEHLLIDDCFMLEKIEPIIITVVKYNSKLKSWSSAAAFYLEDHSRVYEEFGKLRHLEYLDLTKCEPKLHGSSWLEGIAMNCKKLKRLELGSWKRLTDEDLVPILTQCKKLSYLYIPHTPKITSWALTLACDNLPKLRHICIFSCEKISTEMVEDLAEIYKHVNFYQKKKWTEPI